MRRVEIVRGASASDRSETVAFVEDVTRAVGRRPLSDHLWLDLTRGGAPGFVAVTVTGPDGIDALAQISRANESSSLEVVVRPGVDAELHRRLHDDVFETAVDAFRADGGGQLHWWVDDATDADHELARRHGFAPERHLLELRRGLPVGRHATVETRAFVPGQDDEAWLAVNNRAFAGHGEQGGWTRHTLALRLAEPWFDADGFRLHERDGRLAAFCWTKLHHAPHGPGPGTIGEIYVIAVDPDFHGLGLGRELTLAGLDSIAARGVTTANLFVDADNTTAVGLYDRLGFTVHHSRQAFVADLEPL